MTVAEWAAYLLLLLLLLLFLFLPSELRDSTIASARPTAEGGRRRGGGEEGKKVCMHIWTHERESHAHTHTKELHGAAVEHGSSLLPERALYLPTFSDLQIVNKLSLSLYLSLSLPLSLSLSLSPQRAEVRLSGLSRDMSWISRNAA